MCSGCSTGNLTLGVSDIAVWVEMGVRVICWSSPRLKNNLQEKNYSTRGCRFIDSCHEALPLMLILVRPTWYHLPHHPRFLFAANPNSTVVTSHYEPQYDIINSRKTQMYIARHALCHTLSHNSVYQHDYICQDLREDAIFPTKMKN